MHQKTVLDNGLRVLSSHMPHVGSVSISVLVGAGSRYETAEQAGISHFLEHMVFKGTQSHPTSRHIAETVEQVGGVLNAGTDKELTAFWIKIMKSHLKLGMGVLADLIYRPLLESTELERERRVIIEEINMTLDSPQQLVNMLIDEVVWPEQALGRDVAGNKETVSSISIEMLRNYWSCQYGPNNTVISVAGNATHEEVVHIARLLFDDWHRVNLNGLYPSNDFQDDPRIHLEKRETEQTHLCIALRGVSNRHPDRFIVDIINVILGEGMSCRLFRELRENKGLAYDVHSYVSHFFDSGSLTIYAGLKHGNIESAIEAILGELRHLRETTVPEDELAKAKEMIKGRLVLRMEDSRSVSSWMASQELLLNRIQSVDEVISIIDSITTDDIARVTDDLFRTPKLSMTIVGPHTDENRLQALLVI
ncbi:MAG: pitrilysin family protein [Dehalococcoidia bacterium]